MASERPRRGRKPLVYGGEELRCTWRFEEEARAEGRLAVAGMDEVGRGALCGPVVACVVILGDGFDTDGIDDSKRLTALQREALSLRIRAKARAFSVGVATWPCSGRSRGWPSLPTSSSWMPWRCPAWP